jgi:hypothetical protein
MGSPSWMAGVPPESVSLDHNQLASASLQINSSRPPLAFVAEATNGFAAAQDRGNHPMSQTPTLFHTQRAWSPPYEVCLSVSLFGVPREQRVNHYFVSRRRKYTYCDFLLIAGTRWECVCLSLCLSVGLSVCLSVCLSLCPSVCPSVCPSACLSVCLPVCRLSVCLPVCLSVCLSVCLPVFLSVCLSVCLPVSVCLSVCLSVFWVYSSQPGYVCLSVFIGNPLLIIRVFFTKLRSRA